MPRGLVDVSILAMSKSLKGRLYGVTQPTCKHIPIYKAYRLGPESVTSAPDRACIIDAGLDPLDKVPTLLGAELRILPPGKQSDCFHCVHTTFLSGPRVSDHGSSGQRPKSCVWGQSLAIQQCYRLASMEV